MHSYSIDSDSRKNVIYVEVALSFAISVLLHALFGNRVTEFMSYLSTVNGIGDFINALDNFGLLNDYFSVIIIYGLLHKLYSSHLWKQTHIKRRHNIPDLNGEWEGTLKSSYNNFNTSIPIKMAIKQDWNKISFRSSFSESTSYSNNCGIDVSNVAGTTIYFGFVNNSKELKNQVRQYEGYNVLTLNEDGTISARYFNNRGTNCNYGTFELQKVQS